MEQPLVDKKYRLEKRSEKGSWTFIIIPEIPPDKRAHFGMVKVKGSIDNYAFRSFNLMPMKNGSLFLPVRAEIRKTIGKKEGDCVQVILFPDNEPLFIPEELLLCLSDEPLAKQNFLSLTGGAQKEFIKWIYSAKKEEEKIDRIAKTINTLLKGQ